MNFSMRLFPVLEIQIRGSERRRIANVEVATESQHNGDRDLVDSGAASGVDYGRSRKKEVASTRHVQKIVTVNADEKGYGKSL
jgi:hypothetical protein